MKNEPISKTNNYGKIVVPLCPEWDSLQPEDCTDKEQTVFFLTKSEAGHLDDEFAENLAKECGLCIGSGEIDYFSGDDIDVFLVFAKQKEHADKVPQTISALSLAKEKQGLLKFEF